MCFSGSWQVRGLGEISYWDDIMCWTTAEQLLCGHLHTDRISDVTTVLQTGEAYDAGICQGNSTYPLISLIKIGLIIST